MTKFTLNSIMLGTARVEEMAAFYEKVLERKADMVDGGWHGWQMGSFLLTVGEHSEVGDKAKEPQRIIMNLETTEVKDEFERIKKLGATVIKEPYDMQGGWIATFADPDGNYFQLMTPWEEEK